MIQTIHTKTDIQWSNVIKYPLQILESNIMLPKSPHDLFLSLKFSGCDDNLILFLFLELIHILFIVFFVPI